RWRRPGVGRVRGRRCRTGKGAGRTAASEGFLALCWGGVGCAATLGQTREACMRIIDNRGYRSLFTSCRWFVITVLSTPRTDGASSGTVEGRGTPHEPTAHPSPQEHHASTACAPTPKLWQALVQGPHQRRTRTGHHPPPRGRPVGQYAQTFLRVPGMQGVAPDQPGRKTLLHPAGAAPGKWLACAPPSPCGAREADRAEEPTDRSGTESTPDRPGTGAVGGRPRGGPPGRARARPHLARTGGGVRLGPVGRRTGHPVPGRSGVVVGRRGEPVPSAWGEAGCWLNWAREGKGPGRGMDGARPGSLRWKWC